ncbi:MAG: acyl-CoA dehydrogenase family protein, partial [Burkholderiales bacterium]
MDFTITDEQRAFVDTVRKVCRTEFAPRAMKWLDGTWPQENMKRLAEIGVLGMAVPQEYGGSGLGILDTVLVLEEIGKVDYVTAMAALGEVGVQTRIIATYAPESIKKAILPRVANGEAILAICMTEPDAGTDVPAYKTNTEVKGDRVVVRGVKTLISRADIAEMFVVFTRVNRVPGAEGIGCVLIPGGVEGLTAKATFHTMGGEYLSEVIFDDIELPLENLCIRDNGMKRLLSAFNTQRCLNPAICLGLAEGALEEAVKYMRERKAFGRSIGDFQGMRWKVADMYIQIEAGRGLLYRAAVSGRQFPDPTLAAMAKIYCNEMSIRVTSEAIQVH